jgi:hypothetical protein
MCDDLRILHGCKIAPKQNNTEGDGLLAVEV